jgi:hypothetical protein
MSKESRHDACPMHISISYISACMQMQKKYKDSFKIMDVLGKLTKHIPNIGLIFKDK